MNRIFIVLIVNCLTIVSHAQNFNEALKVVAADRDVGDHFGNSVSISGNYAIVGAEHEKHDAAGGGPPFDQGGSAYIYKRDSSGNWNQLQKIIASDKMIGDLFSWSVSISGNYAIVGAWAEDENPFVGPALTYGGSAYIFERRNGSGNWNQKSKIMASDKTNDDWFGESVSISGNYAIVGAGREDHDVSGSNYLFDAGSAYIFERRNGSGNWNEVQKIVASDRDAQDQFGHGVSISGNYALVGTWDEDKAYIFERDGSGNWNEAKIIVNPDSGSYNHYSRTVSINGNYAILGAHGEDEDASRGNTLTDAGAAYIFERDGSGNWNHVQKIVASDREVDDQFGKAVSISGNYAIVGVIREGEDVSGGNTLRLAGSAYIYKRDGSGNWNEVQKIVASDRDSIDMFGYSVAISENYAIVGAWAEDENASGGNTLSNAGSAYIFETPVTDIKPIIYEDKKIKVYPNPTAGEIFIALSNPEGNSKNIKACIYDRIGREVINTKPVSIDHDIVLFRINMDNMSEGLYIYKLFSEDGVIGIGKLMIQD